MKVFLIVVAVLVVLFALICSLSATLTLIYDNGWHTSVQVLFIKKDIVLSEILSFLLFPEKKAEEAKEKLDKEKNQAKEKGDDQAAAALAEAEIQAEEQVQEKDEKLEQKTEEKAEQKEQKPNYFKQLWNKQGIIGILSLVSNLLETASSAVTTLFRGFHIYSFYVKIIVGGSDAADIAEKYGTLCSFYYPVKGVILNGMKVDAYDDYIQPDFIAPRSEYEFQLIGSLSVGLILKMAAKAGIVFLKNFIKDNKEK